MPATRRSNLGLIVQALDLTYNIALYHEEQRLAEEIEAVLRKAYVEVQKEDQRRSP
ncbi:MAG: hypothetical protein HY681_01230 [Chloroflexi bacterium]|nr:hypothetical protein [Chloroflexota bacterium]